MRDTISFQRNVFTIVLVLLLGTSLACAFPAHGAQRYVSASGSDTNPGTETKPWKTASKAAAAATAGDIVYFRSGTWNERLIPQNSGTAGREIVFRSYPGERAVFDAKGISYTWGGVVLLNEVSHIVIDSLTLKNSAYAGAMILESSHCVIQNCSTDYSFSSGVYVKSCKNITVNHNDIQRACHGIGGSPPHFAPQEHISIAGTHGFEVKGNKVHNPNRISGKPRGKEGIDAKSGSSNGTICYNKVFDMTRVAIYVDAFSQGASNIDVFGNEAYNCTHGLTVASEKGGFVKNIRIYNNRFYWHRYYGIWLSSYLTGTTMENVYIYNNTIANNQRMGLKISTEYAGDMIVRNNICANNGEGQLFVNAGSAIVDHNLEFGTQAKMRGAGAVKADPQFQNTEDGTFTLNTKSPCIDAGNRDVKGISGYESRFPISGRTIDIGAVEFLDSTTKALPEQASSPGAFSPAPLRLHLYNNTVVISGL